MHSVLLVLCTITLTTNSYMYMLRASLAHNQRTLQVCYSFSNEHLVHCLWYIEPPKTVQVRIQIG
jgi:hypothetical protein